MDGLCRLCAETRALDKMTEINDPMLNLEQKLIDCCRWNQFKELRAFESLPPHICIVCIEKLEQSWSFAESVADAQFKLIEMIDSKELVSLNPFNQFDDIDRKFEDNTMDDYYSNENANDASDQSSTEFVVTVKIIQDQPIINTQNSKKRKQKHSKANQVVYQLDEHAAGCSKSDLVEKPTISEKISTNTEAGKSKIRNESEVELNQVNFDESEGDQCSEDEDKLFNSPNMVGNFLHLVKSDDRNDDGTINPNAIQRLGLVNWMVLQHQCCVCYVCFSSNYELKSHIMSEHSENDLQYMCSMCQPRSNRRHQRRANLHKHIVRKHHPHLKYCCIRCNKFFWDLKKLRQHILSHTSRPYRDKLSVMCHECGGLFDSESAFRTHARSHLPAQCKPIFQCYICKKEYLCRLSLRHHMPNHAGGRKRFKCETCGRDFARRDILRRHQHLHVDVFNFPCLECGKKFRYDKSLQIHKNVHTGSKPFGCPICEYRCSNESNVYKHIRQTHGMPQGHGLKVIYFEKNSRPNNNS